MSENQSLLRIRDGSLYWLEPGQGDVAVEDDALERLRVALAQRNHQIVFAAPGEDVRLLEVSVTREERRHLDQALPFMLEEQLSEDIEGLHFARGKYHGNELQVAVVSEDCMGEWQAQLGDLPPMLPWIPEPLLLPWQNGEWTVVLDGDRALLRLGPGRGACIEFSHLPLLLSSLGGQAPDRVVVYAPDDTQRPVFESWADRLEWRRGGLAEALLLGQRSEASLDLRQGAWAPRLPYEAWWRQWRPVAAVLLVGLVLHTGATWLDLRRLDRENLVLRGEVQALYRQVNPRGNVVDAERQLRRQIQALSGEAGDSSFTALLAPLGEAVSERRDTRLASLNYSQRSGELRVNLLAPDFDEVEALRQALIKAGLQAKLENTSRNRDRVRARLSIGGGA